MRLLGCAVLAIAFVGQARTQETVSEWVVIGTVGKWCIAGTKTRIAFGASLMPGTSVERDPPGASSGSLTVLAGDTPFTYACDDAATLPDHSNTGCAHPITLPSKKPNAGPGQNSKLLAFFVALPHLFSQEPNRYYAAVSRDYGTIQDAVVQKTNDSVDLKPALRSVSKGEYHLIFEKLDPGKPPAPVRDIPATLRWNPDTNQPAVGPDLQPGLYHLQLETLDREPVGDAWILVSSPQDYARKSASFEEITKATSAWVSNVPAAGIRAVNRAALDQLSR